MKSLLHWILMPVFVLATTASLPAAPKSDPIQRIVLGENPLSPDCTLRLDLSQDWARLDRNPGEDSNITRYRSGKGAGALICTIVVNKAFDGPAEQLTDEKAAELVSPAKLRENLTDPSQRVLRIDPFPIAGKAGGRVIMDSAPAAGATPPPGRTVLFATLDRNYLILISFAFRSGDPGALTLDDAQTAYMPTFEAVLKTAVRVPRPAAVPPASAADEVARRNEIHELTEVLRFNVEQTFWLDRIRRDFPDLRDQARSAAATYEASVFGKGGQGSLDRLGQLLGAKKFEDLRTSTIQTCSKTHSQKPFTAADATKRLTELNTSAITGPAGDLRAILLAMNPDFRKKPELEISGGWTQHLTLNDALPLEDYKTGINLPASWARSTASSPDHSVSFISGYGYGPVTCVIRARKALESPLSDKEAAALFTPDQLKARTAGEKSTLISSGFNEVTGHPGGWLFTRSPSLGNTPAHHTTTYLTFEGPYLIRIDLAVFDDKIAPLSVDQAQTLWTPTFEAILQSFVRDPRYLPASPKDSLARSQARDLLDTLRMLQRQSFMLDRIIADFSDFNERATRVKADFASSPYGRSQDVMIAELARLEGNDFKPRWEEMLRKWQSEIQNAPLSGITADKYLDTVTGYTRGGFAESIRRTLTATNRDFRQNPAAELIAGCTQPLSLANDFKIPDGKATLSFPISWRVARKDKDDGSTAALLLRSGNGYGAIVCILRVNKAVTGGIPTDEQTAAFLSPESMRKANRDPAMEITDVVSQPIAGRPGVRILADATDPHGRKPAATPTVTYMTFAGPYLINANFSVDPITDEAPAGTRDSLLPFFDAILGTLVRD